ncbi:MAG: hypothetical protein K5644_06435 [Lachnospiraceae bacterium]|nr:hypothetical protein [Lachnospiraceae bacterium]
MSAKKPYKIMFIIGAVISLMYIFFIGQWDMKTITGWGYDMLDCIKQGIFSEFPSYTSDLRQMPSNYTMLANMTTALWLSPVFIIQTLADTVFAMEFYHLWYKVLFAIVHFVNVYLIGKILRKLNMPKDNTTIICSLYMLSSVVLLAVIGHGQVDMVCMLFFLLGVNVLLSDKYYLFALFTGISLIYKPFSMLLVVPILLLLISKKKSKVILYTVVFALPYAFNMLLTKICMPEYNRYVALVDEQCKEVVGTNRIEELFAVRFNSILLFWGSLLIVCFICLYLGTHNKVKKYHYFVMPVLGFMTYAVFVSPSSYWFILIIPVVLFMGQYFENLSELYLLNLGINIGVTSVIYLTEKDYSPNPELSILSVIFSRKRELHIYEYFPESMRYYAVFIATTLFVLCFLIIVGMYIFYNKKKSEAVICQNTLASTYEKVLFYLQPVPVIGYFIIAMIEFFV